jgi:hypothetical protein
VNKALELARGEKTVGKPLDAAITIRLSDEACAYLPELGAPISRLCSSSPT